MQSFQPTDQIFSSTPPSTRKRLIIGSLLIAATLLGATISLVWYFWDQSLLLTVDSESVAKVTGSIVQSVKNNEPSRKLTSIKPVGLVQAIRNNLKIFIPGVVFVILAFTTLIVLSTFLTSSSSETEHLIDTKADEISTEPDQIANENTFYYGEIIGICMLVVLLVAGIVFASRRSVGGLPEKELRKLEEFDMAPLVPLLKSRWAINEDQKCKKSKNGLENPIEFEVVGWFNGLPKTVTVFCPREFSFNSIWWALRTDAKPEDVLQLNTSEVVYNPEHGRVYLVDLECRNAEKLGPILVQRNTCIRKRVPGITPEIPKLSDLYNSGFDNAYKAFSQYAHLIGEECTIRDERENESDIELEIRTPTTELVKYVQCPSKPTIASVFKTIAAGKHFGNDDKIQVVWNEVDSVKKLKVSKFFGWEMDNLWKMYEAMEC